MKRRTPEEAKRLLEGLRTLGLGDEESVLEVATKLFIELQRLPPGRELTIGKTNLGNYFAEARTIDPEAFESRKIALGGDVLDVVQKALEKTNKPV